MGGDEEEPPSTHTNVFAGSARDVVQAASRYLRSLLSADDSVLVSVLASSRVIGDPVTPAEVDKALAVPRQRRARGGGLDGTCLQLLADHGRVAELGAFVVAGDLRARRALDAVAGHHDEAGAAVRYGLEAGGSLSTVEFPW